MLIEPRFVPGYFRDPPIQTGLVRGHGKLAVDPRHILAFGDQQPGQILGKVPAFRAVGKDPAKLTDRLFDDRGKLDDGRGVSPIIEKKLRCRSR
jgi:hypothetical protein